MGGGGRGGGGGSRYLAPSKTPPMKACEVDQSINLKQSVWFCGNCTMLPDLADLTIVFHCQYFNMSPLLILIKRLSDICN